MRKKLKEIGSDSRERYNAKIGRCGIKYNNFKNAPERTLLLNNVTLAENAEIVTDHLWVTVGKTLAGLDLKAGDIITFNARVGVYKKGSHFRKRDYKLNRMTKIEVQRINREVIDDEITSSKPATFEEWEQIREMKHLESMLPDDDDDIPFACIANEVKKLNELYELFNKRYFGIVEKF